MPMMRKLAVLATAAEAARRYAHSNPEQAGRYLDQAASFVDKQTKGKYSGKIDDVARKVKGVAGIPSAPPAATPVPPSVTAPATSPSPTPRPTPAPGTRA